MSEQTINQQSYLLSKAAKAVWREARGDVADAVSVLSDRIAGDQDLRGYIAAIAIAEISFEEINRQIGPAAGRA